MNCQKKKKIILLKAREIKGSIYELHDLQISESRNRKKSLEITKKNYEMLCNINYVWQ